MYASAYVSLTILNNIMRKLIICGLSLILAMGACQKEDTAEKTKIPTVQFSSESKVIKLDGEAISLKDLITPLSALEEGVWSCADASIANVDQEGLVKPVNEGITTVNFTLSAQVYASCEIIVSKDIIEATGVTIVDKKVTLVKNDTYQLEAIINPNEVTDKTLIWESDNEDVVMVDDEGVITAIDFGTAVITVETSNRWRAKCRVTVEKPAFSIPAKMLGTWTGIRMELISQSDGKIFDEEAIAGLLTQGTDVEAWLESVRTSYSYDLTADNVVTMNIPLKGDNVGHITGSLAGTGTEGIFEGTFDVETANIDGTEEYAKQTIVFDGKLVIIQIPFGSGFDFKVYYKVTQ